jgi:hypothetical protein
LYKFSEIIAVATFRMNVYWLSGFWRHVEQAVGGEWEVTNLIGGAEELAAIQ